MSKKLVGRENVLESLLRALEPLDWALAMWEQGAASFDRLDEWSDIDLILIIDDNKVENAFRVVEKALLSLSKIDLKFRLPEPTWHGHSQCFYRLKDSSPFLLVDLAIMKKSSGSRFLEYAIHGKPQVYFDKSGLIKDETAGPEAFVALIRKRLETLKVTFPLFQTEVLKELNRGNDIEAMTFYMGVTYKPLVEVLRIKHCPARYNFHTRYVYYDLPKNVVKKIHGLTFISDGKQLRKAHSEAQKLFWKTMGSIDIDELRKLIGKSLKENS